MRLVKSFKYALRGFSYCIKNERNIRIHTVIALYVLFFSCFFSISKERFILALLTVSSVIAAEMFNTAIEELADFYSYEYNPVVRLIKDVSAGAVVCCAMFAAVIGVVIFCDVEKIFFVINYFKDDLLKLVMLIVSLVFSVVYIVKGPAGIKNLFGRQK